MNIGIDIDGVLTDIEKFQLDYGSKLCFELLGKTIKDSNGYDIAQIFDVSQDSDEEFWNKYLWEYATKEKARKFADEITKKLEEDGNKIYIITARYLTNKDTEDGEKMRNTVKSWLKENNIYYDKIIFSPEDKLDICINNNIDIMIEDKVENIEKISTKIPVIAYNANYNKECKGPNIIRCYSWYDIYSKILNGL